jgi:hypothetical protein
MKRIFTLLITAALSFGAFSQAPEKMSYQAVIRNSNGELVKNSPVGIKVSILQTTSDGTAVYAETHTPSTNNDGLVTMEIGEGTVASGNFASINWSTGLYFIKTETDPTGGTDYTIVGTSQLLSVPYALYAKTTGQSVSIPNQKEGDMLYFDGTKWERIPKGTTGQVMTINSEGKYIWVNQYIASTATTSAVSDITYTSVTLNGTVNANGSSTNVSFEYGTTTGYGQTIAATQSPVTGNRNVAVSATITDIPAGTVYHYRMKAVNAFGTTYGNDMVTKNFPALNTTPVTAITLNSATTGGSLISDGGASITYRGVCWSTTANPTLTSSKTMDGSGTGIFTSQITGLTAGTTYHVRAYAISSVGAAYGNDVSFTTSPASFPTIGLVASYPFNGNAEDKSAGANHGIVVGASLTTDRNGVANSAYYFDGVNNYIKVSGGLPITNSFTIAFWAYSESISGYSNIICDGGSSDLGNDFLINFRGNAIGIRADKNAPLNYEDNSPATLSGLDIVNKWVHVVWVMNPANSKVYLNGIQIAEIDEAGTNEGYHDDFSFFGARQVWGSPDNFFKGKLDDIFIYNRALSDSEINALYTFR